ncbi:MAG: class I SAM-dependent methyltransferase [Chloroflexi bacterium]|nr:class I SAM-dependent methyltransferase [Chloroflexota bacterium]
MKIDISCPLCHVSPHPWPAQSALLWRCPVCGLAWQSAPPDPETLKGAYAAPAYPPRRGPALALAQWLQRRRADWIGQRSAQRRMQYTGSPPLALEIGCGPGALLGALQAKGWRVIGVEGRWDIAAGARRISRIPVLVATNPAAWPATGNGYQLVILWHTLEHLLDPWEALQRTHELLAPEGLLWLAVPNLDSWQARILQDRWLHLDIPRHIYHFTPQALRLALNQTGFHGVEISTGGLGYEIPGWVFSRWGAARYQSWRTHPLGPESLALALCTLPLWPLATLAGRTGAAANLIALAVK